MSAATGFTDSVLGNSITGVDNYTGMGQDGVGGTARFPPPTTMSVDAAAGILYWADSLGGVRYYNRSTGSSAPLCVCRSACTALLYPPATTSINCSQATPYPMSGLVYDSASSRLIAAYGTTSTSSLFVLVSLTGSFTYWCGGGNTYNQGEPTLQPPLVLADPLLLSPCVRRSCTVRALTSIRSLRCCPVRSVQCAAVQLSPQSLSVPVDAVLRRAVHIQCAVHLTGQSVQQRLLARMQRRPPVSTQWRSTHTIAGQHRIPTAVADCCCDRHVDWLHLYRRQCSIGRCWAASRYCHSYVSHHSVGQQCNLLQPGQPGRLAIGE